MSDWKRSTKEIVFEALPPAMKAEIQKHIERYHLGEIRSQTPVCILTTSEKAKKGIFGSAEIAQMGAVVTPRWLVWGIQGTKILRQHCPPC